MSHAFPNCNIRFDEDSTISITRGQVSCSPEEFSEFQEIMVRVNNTPNVYRPSTNIIRKQCAFFLSSSPVSEYKFGQQQDTFKREFEELPKLIIKTIRYVQEILGYYQHDLVQCNYYKDGSAAISPHVDNESCLNLNIPIVSVTFYLNPMETRSFSIYNMDSMKIMDLQIGHGDVIVMSEKIQEKVKHGVDKERANKHGPRINLTLRATQ